MEIFAVNNVPVTRNDIDNIMAAALDGGISHWCGEVDVIGDYLGECIGDQISRYGSIILKTYEDGDIRFSLIHFITGFVRYVSEHPELLVSVDEFDDGDHPGGRMYDIVMIDAEAADQIIQLGAFKDLVYA